MDKFENGPVRHKRKEPRGPLDPPAARLAPKKSAPKKRDSKRDISFFALEPRILYDAAAAATASDPHHAADAAAADKVAASEAAAPYASDPTSPNAPSVGQLELDVARADVDKAKADLAVADAAVSKCKIEAPFSGITVEQKARAFQYATPGQALIDIIDTERLEVELIAPSRWLPWLKPGHLFEVQVDETAKVYPVRVIRLGGRVDPVSQSIKVIGEITDPAPELMAGMSGKASIRPPQ